MTRLLIILFLATAILAISAYGLRNPPVNEPSLAEWNMERSANPAAFQHNSLKILRISDDRVIFTDMYGDEGNCTLRGGLSAHPAIIVGGWADAVLTWKDDDCYVLRSMIRSGHRRAKFTVSALAVLAVFAYLTLTFKVGLQRMTILRRENNA